MTWEWSWTSRTGWPCSTWARRSPRAPPTTSGPTPRSSRPISETPRAQPLEGNVAELTTLPRLLQRNARDLGDRPAIREKDRGIWQSWTWREYQEQVRDFALGLVALGFARGDRLSVIGDNRPRLYWAQVAAQCLGGVPVPVYQDSIAKELAYVWNHAEVSVIVAEDQEQVDKVLALRPELPLLRLVIYDDPRGMSTYRHDWLRSYQEVQEAGRTFGPEHPRYFEDAVDATPLKRRTFDYFRSAAERAEILRAEGKPVPAGLRLATALGEFFVYGPVRDQLGLRRTKWALTGGAPLGPDTFRFFRAIGVNLKQVYGSTETSGLVSLQPDAEANPTSAGRPVPGVEIKIAERGEVLVRGRAIFKGYLKNEEATREVIDPDGWFHTGDAGFIDPRGHLVIIDRAKDVGALADGTPFAPQFVENKLKFSPFIREAVAFGDQKPFVTAMVAIDMSTVGNWAERRSLAYTSYMDLSQKPEVRALIRDEIRKCNETLPEAGKVRRFLLLTKDLEADDAEMTRTRKVRRRFVAEKYAPVLDAFYSGGDEVELATAITYEDGRQATLKSRVHIEDVDEALVRG